MTINDHQSDWDIDLDALNWTRCKIQEESTRLKESGLKPIVLEPKNFGIVKSEFSTHGSIINRIELNTAFDFQKRIKQILISPEQVYPLKPNYSYCHVILLTYKTNIPLVVPYLYSSDAADKNELKEWLFINSKGERARHSILQYHNV